MPLNFEFKARSKNNTELEQKLHRFKPRFAGEDDQCDTYFNVSSGRLKLREGNIENALIHYQRSDEAGAKQSDVLLYQHHLDPALKLVLTAALGVKVVVEKRRRILFVENVKFHFDHIAQLGDFVEVEAIDQDGSIGIEKLREQCLFYAGVFGISEEDCIAESYSDLILKMIKKV